MQMPFALPVYRDGGQPSYGVVHLTSLPSIGATLGVGSDSYVFGTDFSGRDTRRALMSLANRINAPVGTEFNGVVKDYFAEVRGEYLILIATQPGASRIGMTSNSGQITLSGSFFTGGETNSGFDDVSTAVVGTNYTNLPNHRCRRVMIYNRSGHQILVLQAGSTSPAYIDHSMGCTFNSIMNSNQLSVKRSDESNTPVSVHFRFE